MKSGGFTINEDIVKAIKEFPRPRNLTELRSWMGLVNQIGNFNDKTAELAEPLRPLLKPITEYQWDSVHLKAFERMRDELSRGRNLAYYDCNNETALCTDASRLNALGFALKQHQADGRWQMVQAGSRFLSESQTSLPRRTSAYRS